MQAGACAKSSSIHEESALALAVSHCILRMPNFSQTRLLDHLDDDLSHKILPRQALERLLGIRKWEHRVHDGLQPGSRHEAAHVFESAWSQRMSTNP